jgi:hypothetical protein
MADVEVQKLVAIFEARLSQYEKALARARSQTDQSFQRIERRGQQMESALAGLGQRGLLLPLISQLAAVLTPLTLMAAGMRAISAASDLAKFADAVGIGVEALQGLRFGFQLAGADAETFRRGIEAFTDKIGEAATGNTRLAQILRANGVALRDSNGQIRSTESLLRDYADLVANARTEQEKMVLVTEAFGSKGGKRFVLALAQGRAGLDDMKQSAKEAGRVLSEDLVRDAEKLQDEYDKVIEYLKVKWQSFVLTAIKGSKSVLETIMNTDFARGTYQQQVADLARQAEIDNLRDRAIAAREEFIRLDEQLQKLYADVWKFEQNAEGKPPGLMEQVRTDLDRQINQTQAELEKVAKLYAELVAEMKRLQGIGTSGTEPSPLPPPTRQPWDAVVNKSLPKRPTIIPPASEDQLARAIRQGREQLALIEAETQALRGLNPLVEDYGFKLTYARTQQQLLNAAKQANIAITPQVEKSIQRLALETAAATEQQNRLIKTQDELRQQWQELQSLTKDVMSGFISDLKEGTSAAEALRRALNRIADKLVEMSLTSLTKSLFGAGTGANIFGFLIPGLAAGGTAYAGKPHIVGEDGPELFVPGRTGTIIPNSGLKRIPSSSGGTTVVNVDMRESSAQAIAALMQRLDRLESNMPRIVKQAQTFGRLNDPFYGSA